MPGDRRADGEPPVTKADRLERSLEHARLERERYETSQATRLAQVNAQIQLLDGAAQTELQRRHKRRAFLIGEYVISQIAAHPDLYARIFSALDAELTDPAQRKLFDLD
jgi:hypothetical protein